MALEIKEDEDGTETLSLTLNLAPTHVLACTMVLILVADVESGNSWWEISESVHPSMTVGDAKRAREAAKALLARAEKLEKGETLQ